MLREKKLWLFEVSDARVYQAIDELAWEEVEEGCFIADTEGKMQPKKKILWTNNERKVAVFSFGVINVLFAVMDEKNFKLITNCDSAKKAFDILVRSS